MQFHNILNYYFLQSPMDQQHAQALADPMMSSYEAFDMAATAFVSYTTVSHQQTLVSLNTAQNILKSPGKKNHEIK